MVNFLSNLHARLPEMGGVGFFAVVALEITNNKFDHKSLLKQSTSDNIFLNSHLNLQSSRMWFCPNEVGVDHFDSFQTLNMLHTK